MERFINIIVVDKDPKIRIGLKEILSGSGNNILVYSSIKEAIDVMNRKEVGIVLINIDETNEGLDSFQKLKENNIFVDNYVIIITKEDSSGVKLVKGINQGAVDFITYPFNPNLVKSKIEVYKSLFHKDKRINQLLSNIFPKTVLQELSQSGKFSPKRIENGVVLFTDFVDFSTKAKRVNPLRLLRQLERYFTRFDEIIDKYKLEKIKTIGDAYMALSGVTEEHPYPAIRSCLAALEMKEFMQTERDLAIALKKDFWEIRIGLHMGPLVAGIIGTSKFSFDVWGDTVNIAARAENASNRGQITITSTIYDHVSPYFVVRSRGNIDIHKRGGSIEMFYLDKLKDHYCTHPADQLPTAELKKICGLQTMDFSHLRTLILNKLRSLLPEEMIYHDIPHTLNVEKAAMRFGNLEGLSDEEMLILRTAALFHDVGFIWQYHNNEDFAQQMVRSILPEYDYNQEQIDEICSIINSTKTDVEPETLLEKILCDADHDYLGRPDYKTIANKLRKEIALQGEEMTDEEWIRFQLNFLEKHHVYYTETAQNIRGQGKILRIDELRNKLKQYEEKEI